MRRNKIPLATAAHSHAFQHTTTTTKTYYCRRGRCWHQTRRDPLHGNQDFVGQKGTANTGSNNNNNFGNDGKDTSSNNNNNTPAYAGCGWCRPRSLGRHTAGPWRRQPCAPLGRPSGREAGSPLGDHCGLPQHEVPSHHRVCMRWVGLQNNSFSGELRVNCGSVGNDRHPTHAHTRTQTHTPLPTKTNLSPQLALKR